ncbi:unnamed protein product [Protopolystoma xenopodis]|uniref:Uncharacterized protein n=1 Tax=Protopolystoma xenopodis TaxID=117903 RepID=A0A448XHL3_9PLAT|nr:unnamed protein product [Protopolystoma xenopodis]
MTVSSLGCLTFALAHPIKLHSRICTGSLPRAISCGKSKRLPLQYPGASPLMDYWAKSIYRSELAGLLRASLPLQNDLQLLCLALLARLVPGPASPVIAPTVVSGNIAGSGGIQSATGPLVSGGLGSGPHGQYSCGLGSVHSHLPPPPQSPLSPLHINQPSFQFLQQPGSATPCVGSGSGFGELGK